MVQYLDCFHLIILYTILGTNSLTANIALLLTISFIGHLMSMVVGCFQLNVNLRLEVPLGWLVVLVLTPGKHYAC